mmetsp:Transcript_9222/g.25781  ORF Transcript_9222/g.25781 Transcript_9222/m.25781 type:complete len:233 (+) Transcript_9222:582-1280(+)
MWPRAPCSPASRRSTSACPCSSPRQRAHRACSARRRGTSWTGWRSTTRPSTCTTGASRRSTGLNFPHWARPSTCSPRASTRLASPSSARSRGRTACPGSACSGTPRRTRSSRASRPTARPLSASRTARVAWPLRSTWRASSWARRGAARTASRAPRRRRRGSSTATPRLGSSAQPSSRCTSCATRAMPVHLSDLHHGASRVLFSRVKTITLGAHPDKASRQLARRISRRWTI